MLAHGHADEGLKSDHEILRADPATPDPPGPGRLLRRERQPRPGQLSSDDGLGGRGGRRMADPGSGRSRSSGLTGSDRIGTGGHQAGMPDPAPAKGRAGGRSRAVRTRCWRCSGATPWSQSAGTGRLRTSQPGHGRDAGRTIRSGPARKHGAARPSARSTGWKWPRRSVPRRSADGRAAIVQPSICATRGKRGRRSPPIESGQRPRPREEPAIVVALEDAGSATSARSQPSVRADGRPCGPSHRPDRLDEVTGNDQPSQLDARASTAASRSTVSTQRMRRHAITRHRPGPLVAEVHVRRRTALRPRVDPRPLRGVNIHAPIRCMLRPPTWSWASLFAAVATKLGRTARGRTRKPGVTLVGGTVRAIRPPDLWRSRR